MFNSVLKYVGTLAAGCVVGVVVASTWTGQADLNKTLSYVNELEIMIEQHAGNADELLAQLKEQQRIYKQDVEVYYKAVQEANRQTTKANKEIEKANKAAADLKIVVENKVSDIKKKVGEVNEIPPLVNNPDVNHPGEDHDNGVGNTVCTNNSHHNGDHKHSNGKPCDWKEND